jgi:hypothetical protein
VVHGVVLAKLAPRKSHCFVLSAKRSQRLAARAHDAPSFRQQMTLKGAGSGSGCVVIMFRANTGQVGSAYFADVGNAGNVLMSRAAC